MNCLIELMNIYATHYQLNLGVFWGIYEVHFIQSLGDFRFSERLCERPMRSFLALG